MLGGMETTQISQGVRHAALGQFNYAVVDLETSGFSPSEDRILQIGLALMRPGDGVFSEWETKVHPGAGVEVSGEILQLTGLDAGDLARAEPVEQGLAELIARLEAEHAASGGLVLAGHNLAGFDARFLIAAADATGLDFPCFPCLDTLLLSRALYPGQSNHRLPTCLEVHGLGALGDAHHDARADAVATAALLEQQLGDLAAAGVTTLHEVEGLLARSRRPRAPRSEHRRTVDAAQTPQSAPALRLIRGERGG